MIWSTCHSVSECVPGILRGSPVTGGPRGFGQRGHGRNEILGVAGGPDATVTDVVVFGPLACGMVAPQNCDTVDGFEILHHRFRMFESESL